MEQMKRENVIVSFHVYLELDHGSVKVLTGTGAPQTLGSFVNSDGGGFRLSVSIIDENMRNAIM
jgi:hypothetical protein